MNNFQKQKIIAIVGPTASGKTALGIRLAKHISGEIVSADSRQVYKYLNLATGKVTKKETHGIRHHCIDLISPTRTLDVTQYVRHASKAINEIIQRGNIPIVVGGTGFYMDALLHGRQFPEVPPNPALRKKLEKKSVSELARMLLKKDSERAKTIDLKNPRRLIRALEIIAYTKSPVPTLQAESPYNVLTIGIDFPDAELKKKIHLRLYERITQGMWQEIARAHTTHGVSWKRLEALGLECKIGSYVARGLLDPEEAATRLEREIWQYAKRQRTWLKRNKNIHWIDSLKKAQHLSAQFLTR